jgi:hypothetical protein
MIHEKYETGWWRGDGHPHHGIERFSFREKYQGISTNQAEFTRN